jgi:hypothetical protein
MIIWDNDIVVGFDKQENDSINEHFFDEQAEDASLSILKQIYGQPVYLEAK